MAHTSGKMRSFIVILGINRNQSEIRNRKPLRAPFSRMFCSPYSAKFDYAILVVAMVWLKCRAKPDG